jgi:MFS family permease
MNINLGLAAAQFFFATVGSFLVDRFGRRTLLLWSTFSLTVSWAAVVIAAALCNVSSSSFANVFFIVLIFIFSAVFSTGFTPVQALYPSEVLSYEFRAKGMALVSFVQFAGKSLAMSFNTKYAN